ncbi:MAG TPA: cytochrome c [Longimicrobiales bacterium]|nr:cytochrome c [Longimicrobiales bacterium]
MLNLGRVGVAAFAAAVAFAAAPPTPAVQPDTGMVPAHPGATVFARHCAACHTLGGGPTVGPDLAGVTARRSGEWLMRWVDDPASHARADSSAAALVREWGGWVMPEVDLSGPELVDVLDFLAAADAGALGDDVLAAASRPPAGMRCPMRIEHHHGGQGHRQPAQGGHRRGGHGHGHGTGGSGGPGGG